MTKALRSAFAEIGKSEEEINARLKAIKYEFFCSEDRLYHEVGDMGYIVDTGNNDVRTEGMSYGMMITVQLDMKAQFDRIWKWVKTYMYMTEGYNEGYFAWSCRLDGTRNADGPAPDGEEFFAMALFFASHRWGDGEGIFNYSREAREILSACLHKGENSRAGLPMWNRENKLILFGPGCDFTDPSYHLPHFYRLFGRWANEEDRVFFTLAAEESRAHLLKACHGVTGMSAEYAEFDGRPMSRKLPWSDEVHNKFYSDAYRTAANIGLDNLWFGVDEALKAAPLRLQKALDELNPADPFMTYETDGTVIGQPALHPIGLLAATAQGSLAVDKKLDPNSADPEIKRAAQWVERFWQTPMRKGERRYYDNCLYMFAFLALSGNYRIY